MKSYRKRIVDDLQVPMAEKHLSLLVDYTESAYQSTAEHLSVLLKKKEITYGLVGGLCSLGPSLTFPVFKIAVLLFTFVSLHVRAAEWKVA